MYVSMTSVKSVSATMVQILHIFAPVMYVTQVTITFNASKSEELLPGCYVVCFSSVSKSKRLDTIE